MNSKSRIFDSEIVKLIYAKSDNNYMNKKGEEQFLVPEHLIHLIMAIVGIVLLLYIIVKLSGYT